ncbi:unnamed protein product, partial [marine sediment metagenome]
MPSAQGAQFLSLFYLPAVSTSLLLSFTTILGRHINRNGELDLMVVTAVSMGIGSVALLVTGIIVQGVPRLTLINWLIIFWLEVVNSAFAFALWNRTLQRPTAIQSSIINNTMLFQIAILAWIFLKERLTLAGIDWHGAGGTGSTDRADSPTASEDL